MFQSKIESDLKVADNMATNANLRPEPDELILKIADYVHNYTIDSAEAYKTAKVCLLDSLGCAILALHQPRCKNMLGPLIDETEVPFGVRVPGTNLLCDPVKGAFDIATCIRWLDFNDTWLAKEWGHPSDNLGAILAITDHLSQKANELNIDPFTIDDVLEAMISAHEIQGVLALENAFNRVGLDHVILVKIASTAISCKLLGCTIEQTIAALSNAFVDGHSLRTYRHAPNTGSRKSWAAADATSRGLQLAIMAVKDNLDCYPSAISAKVWGFSDVYLKGEPIKLEREFGSYVMENVLFKVSYPAEFHAQTAVEAAIKLHESIKNKVDSIEKIVIHTQEAAMRIINKTGPLYNFADRDHCIQYMVAIGLIYGELKAEHYSDEFAQNPLIDILREKMVVSEDENYSNDYLDPNKRAIGNSVQVFFNDGSSTSQVSVNYPLGHRKRRLEANPILRDKLKDALDSYFTVDHANELLSYWDMNIDMFKDMPIDRFMAKWVML